MPETPSSGIEFASAEARFSLSDSNGAAVLSGAGVELNGLDDFRWDPETLKEGEMTTPLGRRAGREISTLPHAGWRITLQVAEGTSPLQWILRMKIRNEAAGAERIRRFSVLCNGKINTGPMTEADARTLDGLSGAGDTRVTRGFKRESPNNLLVTWRSDESAWEHSVVAGGLTYLEFAKYVASSRVGEAINLNLYAEDPVGRLLDPGEEWAADDWFYLGLQGGDPFAALEDFAKAVQQATAARPNPYHFPTVCAWYASTPLYGGSEFMNDTPGTVRELEAAAEAGFLRYCPVAVRLVPDTYDGTSSKHADPSTAGLMTGNMQWSKDRNTEQGWWDDEHWRRFGHYAEPFETSAKWARAVRERGGIPLTYVQTGHVSHDYAKAHPGHMLGNDISELDRIFKGHNPYVTFDYTDPGFIEHLRDVWKNLGEAGVAGLMFDYPNQAWIETGGFEDPKATTVSAYRNVFWLARKGLGPGAWIQERNIARKVPYLDVTAGLVDSQRVWADTDAVDPAMFRMCGLRWYKTRTLFAYDTDAKNLNRIADRSRDQLRQVLTLLYLLTGRLLLANPFASLSREVIHDLSRIYPGHAEPVTPRPVDAFDSIDHPRTYVLSFPAGETHLILLNTDPEKPLSLETPLFSPHALGGAGLDPAMTWLAHDFWNETCLGSFQQGQPFSQLLRPNEARVIVFRPVRDHPQVLSTNRHVLQGHVELRNLQWIPASSTFTGEASLVENETLSILFSGNPSGTLPVADSPPGVSSTCRAHTAHGLFHLDLHSKDPGWTRFRLKFR